MTRWTTLMLMVLLMLVMVSPAAAQTVPTPIPILPPSMILPDSSQDHIASLQATAQAQVEAIDMAQAQSPDVDGHQLWGYLKYLLSTNAANDYAGPFAPLFVRLGLFFTVSMVGSSAWAVAWIASYLLSWAQWMAVWFYRGADFVMQLIQSSLAAVVILAIIAIILIVLTIISTIFGTDLSGLVDLGGQ